MNKRKVAVKGVVLAVAGVFAAPLPVFAAETEAVWAETMVQLYGHLDMSIDTATKGISGRVKQNGDPAQGRLSWQPDISSNLSYFGLRASHNLFSTDLKAVFQIEGAVDVSATPGTRLTNASGTDNNVNGALASRNSFLGLAGGFGAIKVGKTDTPYKLSTARMDPFSASVGDYNSIMGNTGGDNRAEFDLRLSHSAWYESPNWSGFSFSALYSPGQNRSPDNLGAASGEPSCTGGNLPLCNDGAFDNAYSLAGVYQSPELPLYVIVAYELHKRVNRTTDEAANGGDSPDGSIGIFDEHAYKFGVQYKFPTKTTVNVIYERMIRNSPDPNFNERDRHGWWLALTQRINDKDDVSFGWGHASRTPGDPGTNRLDGTHATGPVDNWANMYTIMYKHNFDNRTTWYAVYARQVNSNGAHYDLGASGHGITTDCHDGGASATPGTGGSCFTGATVQAFSVGMSYNF
ncbi:MAG TPA: porin [Burkholderiales bacterium]|nr:porin [Burkholderiales bacterium]